jgi:F-type H+/Na+-transporting ATPase subunit alpha
MNHDKFQALVDSGRPVGEIIAVEGFLIKVRGLQPVNEHALILFEDGSKGYVHMIQEDYVVVFHMGSEKLRIGLVAVVQHDSLSARVGKKYIGRVISVFGEPLDGKGLIEPDGTWPIFHTAPMLYERERLDTPLETGIAAVDVLFSIVRGQRMALLGDSKSGKSSLATQIAINQRNTDITTIYVLIAKRRLDVIELVDRLTVNDALEKTIVIVATSFDSLVVNYLAPYVGAAMGEYLWQHMGQDTLVIYDDLANHAMAYREISLIAGVSPGRDSYPGDMFYRHSSLVERAGLLSRNHASQTVIPITYAPDGDITAFLPTNVMSMTDGQWVLDMAIFRENMRPAVSTGLSVTRVGSVGQNERMKALAEQTRKALAAYAQAEEYAHFGSELSVESQADLQRGKNLHTLFNQAIGETYTFLEQQILLDIVLHLGQEELVDILGLKQAVRQYAPNIVDTDEESNYEQQRDELKSKFLVEKGQIEKEPEVVMPKEPEAVEEKPTKKHAYRIGRHKEEVKEKSEKLSKEKS